MAPSLSVNNIPAQVNQLGKEEQLTLLQQIAYLLKRKEATSTIPLHLSSLSGLGGDVWEGERNIDEYIDAERQW